MIAENYSSEIILNYGSVLAWLNLTEYDPLIRILRFNAQTKELLNCQIVTIDQSIYKSYTHTHTEQDKKKRKEKEDEISQLIV